MVLRPVELDAAANPRAGQSDKRRLDDILAVDEVVIVRLVTSHVDAAAELRQDHDSDELVLQMNGRPRVVVRNIGDAVIEGQRIHSAAGALINTLLDEHRIAIGLARRKGRN